MTQWLLVGILAASLHAGDALAQHSAPLQQPTTAEAPAAPEGEMALGTIRIPRGVLADGKPLPAGTYHIRLTAQAAKPDAVGATESLARWVEFVRGGQVRGREVVNIVPGSEIKLVAQDRPPAQNQSKVEMLRGNEYLRVWINRGGHHFLIHLPVG